MEYGRVFEMFSLAGVELPITGRARNSGLVFDTFGGQSISARGGSMGGKIEQGALVLRIVNPGQSVVTMRMSRRDASIAQAGGVAGNFAGRGSR